uniref:SUI1 domain-containing protein n=1 Tax=Corethron hystrix TaxID=216773 RepID=A0A7S1BFS6_9STRA|mmetsp:Transcript_26199/g.60243  ORF Transcript_26199/g.60243 Transcript_26199/m.60243 type:complete len:276 (+) Transcript_26199:134-961(+)
MAASEKIIVPEKIAYCQKCDMPPEYCEYGPDFESHCVPWLKAYYPSLFKELYVGKFDKERCEDTEESEIPGELEASFEPWTTDQRLMAFYEKYEPSKVGNVSNLLQKYAGKEDQLFTALVKKYGDEPTDPYYDHKYNITGTKDIRDGVNDAKVVEKIGEIAIGDKKKRRGAGAKKTSKVDTRVIIQKITRNRKKAVTIVVGMDTVPGLKLKDVSKSFSKKFAGSSSVKDTGNGTKEIIIQGDHTDDVATMIVNTFKVSANAVFLDVDGEFVPFSN